MELEKLSKIWFILGYLVGGSEVSLAEKRYNWQNDLILAVISNFIEAAKNVTVLKVTSTHQSLQEHWITLIMIVILNT